MIYTNFTSPTLLLSIWHIVFALKRFADLVSPLSRKSEIEKKQEIEKSDSNKITVDEKRVKELKSKKMYKEYSIEIPYKDVSNSIDSKISEILPH